MKILITAFQPFGGEKINPALEAMNLLPDYIGESQIIKLEIPTVFHKSTEMVWKAIDREKPDAIMCLGQAGGRSSISLERIAINIDDTNMADNEGNQPVDQPIFQDGQNAYFATLPIKDMVKAIKTSGIPAAISNSAGTYVCNHVMYGVLHKIHSEKLNIRAGFIHVPFIPGQVLDQPNKPSMSLEDIVKALGVACQELDHKKC